LGQVQAQEATLVVPRDKVLQDEAFEITVTGLNAWDRVTLELSTEIGGAPFASQADYHADAEGRVDLSIQASVSGSYQGVDPMGLFWSMIAAPGSEDQPFESTEEPWELPSPQVYELRALRKGTEIASTTLTRVIVQEGVQGRRLAQGRLRGALFLPEGPGPHPAMIVVSGSGGGYSESTAAALASRGYAALGLAYFNAPDLPDQLAEIPLEYFEDAIEWLGGVPEVDPERIGVIGGSRGGELALLIGSVSPRIRVVVSKVPSHVVWGACCDESVAMKSAWTREGEPVPFLDASRTSMMAPSYWKAVQGDYLAYFWLSLADSEAEARATIPVENISGPILLISGGDDQLWPSTYMADRLMGRLDARGFPHPYVHLRYDDAGHALGITPYWPTERLVSVIHPVVKEEMALGGTAESLAHAALDSWKRTLEFLDLHLRGEG
jgi:dienelactone hydrolase